MPDDFVINVRQIEQYAPVAVVLGDDSLLLQRGGLGGPYISADAAVLVATALASANLAMGVGVTPPADAGGAQLITNDISVRVEGGIRWNCYLDDAGLTRYTGGNVAAMLAVSAGFGLVYQSAPAGAAGQVVSGWVPGFSFLNNQLTLYGTGQITLGRDAAMPTEAATWGQLTQVDSDIRALIASLRDNSVWSFNGRVGDILLSLADVMNAGGAPIESPDFIGVPTVPDIPEPGDASEQIANTDFVQRAIGQALDTFVGVLVEPFAPDAVQVGQLWFEHPGDGQLRIWDGISWNLVVDQPAWVFQAWDAPANPRPGMLWYDARCHQLMIWNGMSWAPATPVPQPVPANWFSPQLKGRPTAPTAPSVARNSQIANTLWVGRRLDDFSLDVRDQIVANLRGYAPINSPSFTGMPLAPTPEPGSNDAKIATTAFVRAAVVDATTGVSSFNTRTGDVLLQITDITQAGGAPIQSPHFQGFPEAETPPTGTSSKIIANTEWVLAEIASQLSDTVSSWNGRRGDVQLWLSDVLQVGGAPIHSPLFTGVPQADTPAPGDSSGRLATTAFVTAAITSLAASLDPRFEALWNYLHTTKVVNCFNQRTGSVTLMLNDLLAAGGAPLDSPALTGCPTAPTPPPADGSARLATTAYVDRAIWSNPGPAGPAGLPGPVGPAGPPGQGIAIAGQVPTYADLPASAGVGDVWLVGLPPTQTGYWWTGTTWLTMGTMTVEGPYLLLAGGTLTGNLMLAHNPTQLLEAATKQYVDQAVSGAGVTSFNGRTGGIILMTGDVTGAGGAPLASPGLTGTPTAPTAAPGTNTTQLATTAFVAGAIAAAGAASVTSFNTRTGAVVLTQFDVAGVGAAMLASPAFTGVPSGPTAAPGTGTTQLATTAFVQAAIAAASGYLPLTGGTLTGNLTIAPVASGAGLWLNRVAGQTASIYGQTSGSPRWQMNLGGNTAESGGNAGSDFELRRYNDAGALIETAFAITRATGLATYNGAGVTLNATPAGTNTTLTLNKQAAQSNNIYGQQAGLNRWLVQIGNAGAESGANTGSDFQIASFTDDGVTRTNWMNIARATGIATWFGNLVVNKVNPTFTLNRTTSGSGSAGSFWGQVNGLNRWVMALGDGNPESGSNAGSNFGLFGYTDDGLTQIPALTIVRATGLANFGGPGGIAIQPPAGSPSQFLMNATAGATSLATFVMQCGGGSNTADVMYFYKGASGLRWQVNYADGNEGGANSGSDINWYNYSDTGQQLGLALRLTRQNGMMTLYGQGGLTVLPPAGNNASIVLNKPSSGLTNQIMAQTNAVNRWVMNIGNNTAESGGNTGSDFVLGCYQDNGATRQPNPLTISRATSVVQAYSLQVPESILVTDFNNITIGGYYRTATGPANSPTGGANDTFWVDVQTTSSDANYMVQKAWTLAGRYGAWFRVKAGGVWSQWMGLGPAVGINFSYAGKPAASTGIVVPITFPMVIPANLAGSLAFCLTAPAAAFAIAIYLWPLGNAGAQTQIGAINFAAGSPTGTASGAGRSLAVGDVIFAYFTAADANINSIGITLAATRG